ncbi:NB-ARC domain-containing protein [Dermacoccus abyssi]
MTLNRTQMYAAVYSFERDVRRIVQTFIATHHAPESLLTSEEREIALARRRSEDPLFEDLPLEEFLDLRPSYDLLNRHRGYLPTLLASEVRSNTSALDSIVPIRQRLMHARPLAPDDASILVSSLSRFSDPRWVETHRALDNASDPNWIPDIVPALAKDRILHNIPLADYDETGLIGRGNEADRIAQLMARGRENVITLTGEGGIGKTALAIDVAYKLADMNPPPYEAIIWVTLKKERLTGSGVEQIRDALAGLTEAAQPIGRLLDDTFTGTLEDLHELLNGIPTLICLDNLESVSGNEFVSLYETLPANVRYLVTSRNGIGQLERRIAVQPLEEKDSVALLSRLITSRAVTQLANLSGAGRKEIVRELRNSPLAIRWWVLATESGRRPTDLIKNQDELLTFCVKSVYDALTPEARRCAIALDVLSGEATLHRILSVTGDDLHNSERALQELTRGSLVRSRIDLDADMETLVTLTETANRFLKTAVPPEDPTRTNITATDARYLQQEERRLHDIDSRLLSPIVVHHRSLHDGPTCQKLREAILANREDIDRARSLIVEARAMSPGFWEVDRVEAYIESYHSAAEVVASRYLSAIEKCETDKERAICSHFYSGHLARNMHDLDLSLEHARFAHKHLNANETLIALGNAEVRKGYFEDGVARLGVAASTSHGKSRLIALTGFIAGQRRWAEYCLAEERNHVKAFDHAREGTETGFREMRSGVFDTRLINATIAALNELLKSARSMERSGQTVPNPCFSYSPAVTLENLIERGFWDTTRTLMGSLSKTALQNLGLAGLEATRTTGEDYTDKGGLIGAIVSLEPTYGFIRNVEFPGNVFFHHTTLSNCRLDDLQEGDFVEFLADSPDENGRIGALWVKIAEE